MKFTKKELTNIFRAIKILESGEELIGIDVDKEIVDSLISKIKKELDKKTFFKIDREVKNMIKESRESSQEYVEETESSEEGFDREFGPNYPYSSTLEILKQAIEEDKCVEINYYSASRGEFTKRKVKPESIERRSGTPYLNAYCYLRSDDRVFKLGRIKTIKMVK